MKNEFRKQGTRKGIAALVALVLILCAAVGSTIAWITAQTDPVVNRFEAGSISTSIDETFDGRVKSNVTVKNDGNIPAYIRAAIVVNWVDEDGNVSAVSPVLNQDYTMTLGSAWKKIGDYYYYKGIVPAKESTAQLIVECKKTDSANAPSGCDLQVMILAEAIQSSPANAISDAWKVQPVDLS